MSLSSRWSRELDELKAQGRLRSLSLPAGHDFSSNDYLGYGRRAELDDSDLPRSGTASRLLRGHHELWDEVEARLAEWHGTESALIFTSGYAANEGLLSTLPAAGDWVASDKLNHASIIDGLRLSRAERFVYHHNDLEHLESGLRRADRAAARFVVTESLFGLEGDVAPLADLAALADRYGAHLIVDEAHATGCFGERGGGLVDSLGLRDRVLATVHTGGKALGVPGAYVAGSRLMRDYLINRCRHLVFTTALPPRIAAWWLDTLPRVQSDAAARRRLHDNAARFREKLRVPAGGAIYIVPVILGEDASATRVAEALQAAGFDVRAIRPPTVPAGTARLRISIRADHELALLDELSGRLAEAMP
jgi:8-amino-7-oxononanoate synthase